MRDVLDYIGRTDESAILLNLDQEKAFDRVNRSFLLSLFIAFGFGFVFCRWISIFYEGAFMQIIVNNWLSEKRVRLYADDTTVLLRDLPSLASLLDCINIYEKGSGAKLSRSKSKAMWLGA